VKKSIIIGAIFFVLDAFVMNQGAISLILILTIILWWLPKSAFKKYKKQSAKQELTKVLIYGFIVIAVFTSNSINNRIAQKRANDLVLIIENFHQVTGDYPKTLNDLVPSYDD
jgi:membrane-bound ClpP family serine protease